MLLYLISVVLLVAIFLWQYFTLRGAYYTSRALLKFREVRFKSAMNLSGNLRSDVSLLELEDHLDFLNNTDNVIQNFSKIMPVFVKFRFIKYIYINILFSSNKLKNIQLEKADSVLPYKIEFADALNTLFKAIPLFKVRIIAHLFEIVLTLFVKIGFHKLSSTLSSLKKLTTIEKDLNSGCYT